jgi:hypothetical protein
MNGRSSAESPSAASTKGNTTTAAAASKCRRNGADSEEKRHEIELYYSPLLLLIIDDVERIDDRFHPCIRAPQRNRKAYRETKRKLAVALVRSPHDFVAKHVQHDQLKLRASGQFASP